MRSLKFFPVPKDVPTIYNDHAIMNALKRLFPNQYAVCLTRDDERLLIGLWGGIGGGTVDTAKVLLDNLREHGALVLVIDEGEL